MKVVFAIPAYRGIQCIPFIDSLQATLLACNERGWIPIMSIISGCCYIQTVRNNFMAAFIKSDADMLFFIDDDIVWKTEDAIRLIEMEDEIVCGIYPYKMDREDYPVVIHTRLNHSPIAREDGCLSALYVPAGFLRIKRTAIEKMIVAYPDKMYQETIDGVLQDDKKYDLFPQGISDGRWMGEDFAFCKLWDKIGGQIWIQPNMDLIHMDGNKSFKGNYQEFLLKQPKVANV